MTSYALRRCLCLVVALQVGAEEGLPDYGPPNFAALSALCLDDGARCNGDVCDWLNLVAFRGGFTSIDATKKFVDSRLASIGPDNWRHLNMPQKLMEDTIAYYHNATCPFAPRATEFRPWRRAIDGVNSPNHKLLLNTSTDGRTDGVFIGNVYAEVPGAETFHHHQQVSIFIHWGAPPCQYGIDENGTVDDSGVGCADTITPETPKTLDVLFTGPQWVHSNWLLKPMSYDNARNCPHDEAPQRYGQRGFMFRIFIPMNETDVLYPPDPRPHVSARVEV